MNYSEFLFTQILRAKSERFDEMEYDILFQYGNLYHAFEESVYNDETKSEYECIEDFLDGTSYITMQKILDMVIVAEDIYFITGLEYGVRSLDSVNPQERFQVSNLIAVEFNLL